MTEQQKSIPKPPPFRRMTSNNVQENKVENISYTPIESLQEFIDTAENIASSVSMQDIAILSKYNTTRESISETAVVSSNNLEYIEEEPYDTDTLEIIDESLVEQIETEQPLSNEIEEESVLDEIPSSHIAEAENSEVIFPAEIEESNVDITPIHVEETEIAEFDLPIEKEETEEILFRPTIKEIPELPSIENFDAVKEAQIIAEQEQIINTKESPYAEYQSTEEEITTLEESVSGKPLVTNKVQAPKLKAVYIGATALFVGETYNDLEYFSENLEIDNNLSNEKESKILRIEKNSTEKTINIKAGDGDQTFFAEEDSIINLKIDSKEQDWRLFIIDISNLNMPKKQGEVFDIPKNSELLQALIYNNNGELEIADAGEKLALSLSNPYWHLFLFSLKEVPLDQVDSLDLERKTGILIGPKSTSLFFYNANRIEIKRQKIGHYQPANYDNSILPIAEDKSFSFSKYHDNTFVEGNDETKAICLECEENSTYGWNVKFSNGLFMSIDDLVEYQNRNKILPAKDGVLYHGANRLEFANIDNIRIYRKPFYYGYGVNS